MANTGHLATADNPDHLALLIALEAAVPLWMLELARMTEDLRNHTIAVWARQSASVVASRGDQLMYKTTRRHPTTGTCIHCGQPIRRDGHYTQVWRHDGAGDGRVACDPDAAKAYRAKTVVPPGSTAVPADDGGGTADTFNHLARGLAAAAYVPGGVTFARRHWCTDHAACEAAAAEAEARATGGGL